MVSFWMIPCACSLACEPSAGFRSTRNGAKAPGPNDVEHRHVDRRRMRRERPSELRIGSVGGGRMRDHLHLDAGGCREPLGEPDVARVARPHGVVADEGDRLPAVLLPDRGCVRHRWRNDAQRRRFASSASSFRPMRCSTRGAGRAKRLPLPLEPVHEVSRDSRSFLLRLGPKAGGTGKGGFSRAYNTCRHGTAGT